MLEKLRNLKYTHRPDIRDHEALERNFREKFEALNQVRLTEAEFARETPPTGARSGEATQGGIAYVWRESASATPNPAFRRLDIEVAEAAAPDYVLARLTGYVAGTPRR